MSEQFFGFDPIDKQGYEEWPLYLGILGCHTALNFLGYKPDKGLSRVSDLPGILSDAAHIGMSAYCGAVLSQDKKFCAKARAIYRYKNIGTEVIELKAMQARLCVFFWSIIRPTSYLFVIFLTRQNTQEYKASYK